MKLMVAVPCGSMVHTEFMFSVFKLKANTNFTFTYLKDGLVHDSRNRFASDAINGGFDRILMIDSDMVFEPDIIDRLSADMDTGIEYVAGIFTQRHLPAKPCVYKDLIYGPNESGRLVSKAVHDLDYPRDTLFETCATGFGAVMISVPLIKRVWDHYGLPFHPLPMMGEDLTFCLRARELGAKLYCDSRVKVAHCGQFSYGEATYTAYRDHADIIVEQEGTP